MLKALSLYTALMSTLLPASGICAAGADEGAYASSKPHPMHPQEMTREFLLKNGMRETKSPHIPRAVYRMLRTTFQPTELVSAETGTSVNIIQMPHIHGEETHYWYRDYAGDLISVVVKTPKEADKKPVYSFKSQDVIDIPLFEDETQEIYQHFEKDKPTGQLIARKKGTKEETVLLKISRPSCFDTGDPYDPEEEAPKVLVDKDSIKGTVWYIGAEDTQKNAYLINVTTPHQALFRPAYQTVHDLWSVKGQPALQNGQLFYLREPKLIGLNQLISFNLASGQHTPLLTDLGEITNCGILTHSKPPSSWVSYRDGFETRTLRFTGLFEGDRALLKKGECIGGSGKGGEFRSHQTGPFSTFFLPNTPTGISQKECLLRTYGIDPNLLDHLSFTHSFSIPNRIDGSLIPTVGFFPHGIQEGEKIPAIVHVHGGPEAFTDETFRNYMDVLTNRLKAAVFCLNVRGSTGFGLEHFLKARRNLKGVLSDIKESRDFIAALPFVNSKNLFMMGESWGGTLTGLMATSGKPLFKGLISVAGVYDWKQQIDHDVVESGELSAQAWQGRLGLPADPRVNRAVNAALSPALRLEQVNAPWLVIHGTADTAVRSDQADRIRDWCIAHPGQERVLVKYIQGGDHDCHNLTHEELLTNEMIAFLEALIKGQPVKKFSLTDRHAFLHSKLGDTLTHKVFEYAPEKVFDDTPQLD